MRGGVRDSILKPDKRFARLQDQVVENDKWEYLDLWSVKVHGNDVVGPGNRQHVGHQLGWYWCSTLVQTLRHSLRLVLTDAAAAAAGLWGLLNKHSTTWKCRISCFRGNEEFGLGNYHWTVDTPPGTPSEGCVNQFQSAGMSNLCILKGSEP